MIRELQPWHANVSKRQVKTPKVYFRDSGIYHHLLGLSAPSGIQTHPKLGASWEGFALEQLTAHLQLSPEEVFFWATHAEAELDLLTMSGCKPIGFEFKYTDTPKITKSMNIALQTLKLEKIFVIYPGSANFKLSDRIVAVGLEKLGEIDI